MVMVVIEETGEVVFRCDAWLINSEEVARKYIRDSGYLLLKKEITWTGNMILWCA